MSFKTVSDDKLVEVEEIINVGKKCKDHGDKKVFISSLTPSSHIDYNSLSNINKFIKEKCERERFLYIDNDNIKSRAFTER